MSKRSIDRKAAKLAIAAARAAGKNDREILDELALVYYDRKVLAQLIASTITPERRAKYRALNNVLIALLVIVALFKVLIVIGMSISIGSGWLLITILIVPLLNVYFIYAFWERNGMMYQICGMLTIAGFLQSVGKSADEVDIVSNLVLTAAVAGLSFYLGRKQFPHLHFLNNVEKDAKGGFIL